MDDLARVRSWLEEGLLLHPQAGAGTIVDLVRALLSVAGVGGETVERAPTALATALGDPDHLVFVLIDGLGVELLDRCAPTGFLAQHRVSELRSVFPSTTAAALTSLATAEYPAQHGIPGWWVYLEEHDLTATVLPFQERFSDLDLRELGVDPQEVFVLPGLLSRATRSVFSVTPEPFLQDVYLQYSTGGTPAGGYEDPRQAFQRVVEHVLGSDRPTYTSVYLPHLDETGHRKGVDSADVRTVLATLDSLVAWLRERLGQGARIVVTGDHGQVNLPQERTFIWQERDPLNRLLRCAPTGEPTVPFFHVREGEIEAFRDAFEQRHPETFALLTPDDLEELELLGPKPLSRETRARIGDLVGIARGPTALYYRPRSTQVTPNVGVHAGLTPGEMRVPLIIA